MKEYESIIRSIWKVNTYLKFSLKQELNLAEKEFMEGKIKEWITSPKEDLK